MTTRPSTSESSPDRVRSYGWHQGHWSAIAILSALCAAAALACGESGTAVVADAQQPAASVASPASDTGASPNGQAFDSHAGNRALYDPDAPGPEVTMDEALNAASTVLRIWHQRKAIMRSRFIGIPTQQSPTDSWIVQEILSEVKPDLMVEAGTYMGGSAVMWAMILAQVNPNGRVVTIDIADQRTHRAKNLPISKKRVTFLLGSSADPAIVERVHRMAEGKRVLVLLDSLHTGEHIAKELAAYAPLVPVGSYVIVQDAVLDGIPAIDAFLAANPGWEVDRKRQRFAVTNTIKGYLKRVR